MAWSTTVYSGWKNAYRTGVGYEIVTPYDAATNKTVVRARLIADADTGQWFTDYDCSGYLYVNNTSGTADTRVLTKTISSVRYSFPSAGSSFVAYTSGNFDIYHDKNGAGTFRISGKFGMDSTSPSYYMPVQTVTQDVTISTNGTITPSDPTTFSVTQATVDIVANTRSFTVSASGSTVPAGIDGSATITYNFEKSTDGVTWSSYTSGSQLVATQKYYFRVYASAEGNSGNLYANSSTGTTTSPGSVFYGYPTRVASITPTRSTVFGSGRNVSLTWTAPDTSTNGASISEYKLAYASSSDNGVTWSSWSSEVSSSETSYTFSSLDPGKRYKFYIKPYSSTSTFTGDSRESDFVYIPSLPTTSSFLSLSKNVKKAVMSFSTSSFDGATGTGYEISARYSGDNGSTWSSWSTLSSSATSPYTTIDLNIAKLYQFRIRSYSDVGYSSYTTSSNLFISAYGYRIDSNLSPVAIELAARYTGDSNDSITVGGVTKTGWKQIESMKRYNGTSFIDFVQ